MPGESVPGEVVFSTMKSARACAFIAFLVNVEFAKLNGPFDQPTQCLRSLEYLHEGEVAD